MAQLQCRKLEENKQEKRALKETRDQRENHNVAVAENGAQSRRRRRGWRRLFLLEQALGLRRAAVVGSIVFAPVGRDGQERQGQAPNRRHEGRLCRARLADGPFGKDARGNGSACVGRGHGAEDAAQVRLAILQHELVELGDQPAFEDAPENGSTDSAEDAAEEEEVDVVAEERSTRQRVQGAVAEAGSPAAISICEGADKRCRDARRDEARQEKKRHCFFGEALFVCKGW